MKPDKSVTQENNQRMRQEIIQISSYGSSEGLKCGIREIIRAYREKGFILVNIISNKFVIYLHFQKHLFQA